MIVPEFELVSVVGARGAKLQFTLSQNFEAASIGT
jgi:hypothetical protein